MAHTRSGFTGETVTPMRPMTPRGSPGLREMSVQLSPPSVDFHSPPAFDALPRTHASPIPAWITLGSESATAMAPTEAVWNCPSEIGSQDAPLSVVFHTPPPTVP